MDDTLRQLGGLLLGSVPTVIFMVLIYAAYTVLVYKPLSKILAERHERTDGAVAKAKADVAAAQARTAEYEQRLREARGAVFKAEEGKRQQAAQWRALAVADARSRAQVRIEQERVGIAQQQKQAQGALQAESQRLAAEIAETVLRPVGGGVR
jgi:F-type H+-transporting ATPase subunit b